MQATDTIEERRECMSCLEEAVHVYRDIVLVESQVSLSSKSALPAACGLHICSEDALWWVSNAIKCQHVHVVSCMVCGLCRCGSRGRP